jgi:hypothetical protein
MRTPRKKVREDDEEEQPVNKAEEERETEARNQREKVVFAQ